MPAIWGKLAADPLTAFVRGDGAAPALPVPPAEAPAAAEAAPAAQAAAGDSTLPDPTFRAAAISFVLFGLAVVIAIVLNAVGATAAEFNPSSRTAANFALFAGFYVAAQVIERLMEFVAPMLPPGRPSSWLRSAHVAARIVRDDAASAAQVKADRAKLALGVAAILGVLASCLFGLFFLKAIGMHVSHTVDAILTGITIAAGTKPLHDFISYLQNKNTPTTTTTPTE